MNKRRIIMHGSFRRPDDGLIEMAGETVAEILDALTRQMDRFHPTAHGRVKLAVVGFITEASLFTPLGDTIELHIVPQLCGGKSALTQILVGVALVGVSFIPGVGVALSSMLLKAGALAIIGGISAMLAPTPTNPTGEEAAKYLGTPRNTTKIGTSIPVLYGKRRIGGHVLSFDINAVEYARGD